MMTTTTRLLPPPPRRCSTCGEPLDEPGLTTRCAPRHREARRRRTAAALLAVLRRAEGQP